MILPKVRDPRFITVRRGGSLSDDDHHLLAVWAADCAEHVLHLFEQARPDDDRPRRAIEIGRAWARGEVTWWDARTAAGYANAAARDLRGAPRHAEHRVLRARNSDRTRRRRVRGLWGRTVPAQSACHAPLRQARIPIESVATVGVCPTVRQTSLQNISKAPIAAIC